MSEVAIRAAQPGEFPAVLELWREADATPSATDDIAGLETLYAHDPQALLVAVDDTGLLGTVIVAWDGWRGAMHRLAVAPTARRRGIAQALVEAGEQRLHRLGARRVNALVNTAREPAVALWERADYVHDTRIGRYVKSV